jgi:hypothetical protein
MGRAQQARAMLGQTPWLQSLSIHGRREALLRVRHTCH